MAVVDGTELSLEQPHPLNIWEFADHGEYCKIMLIHL